MNEQNIEQIISALYDMIQDARGLPLGADKCIVERDKVLDMLDEIIAQLPVELKQARTIVESRNELIGQARREAETVIRQAQEKAAELVEKRLFIRKQSVSVRKWLSRPSPVWLIFVRPATTIWMMHFAVLRKLLLCPWRMFAIPVRNLPHL